MSSRTYVRRREARAFEQRDALACRQRWHAGPSASGAMRLSRLRELRFVAGGKTKLRDQ
jgi:hypothetical protein